MSFCWIVVHQVDVIRCVVFMELSRCDKMYGFHGAK